MKKLNKTTELLEMLSNISNRSISQTRELFDLCDKNFDKLMKLEACIKKTSVSYCPSDKEEVDNLVDIWDKYREKENNK